MRHVERLVGGYVKARIRREASCRHTYSSVPGATSCSVHAVPVFPLEAPETRCGDASTNMQQSPRCTVNSRNTAQPTTPPPTTITSKHEPPGSGMPLPQHECELWADELCFGRSCYRYHGVACKGEGGGGGEVK